MKNWGSCSECDTDFPEPTLADALDWSQTCPSCGNTNELDEDEARYVGRAFMARMETLERQVKQLIEKDDEI